MCKRWFETSAIIADKRAWPSSRLITICTMQLQLFFESTTSGPLAHRVLRRIALQWCTIWNGTRLPATIFSAKHHPALLGSVKTITAARLHPCTNANQGDVIHFD